LDFIVANDASAFDAETNCVTILSADGTIEKLAELPKIEVAKAIIERAVRLLRRP
jgi:phosphopantothenoylcysteine decarboxylase/phosphopantothenate--cysteine ligase